MLLVTIDAQLVGPNIWDAQLTGAEARRLGEPKGRRGLRSIISVTEARFFPEQGLLSFSPERATVLNIGSSDNTLIIDIGIDASAEVGAFRTENNALHPEPL